MISTHTQLDLFSLVPLTPPTGPTAGRPALWLSHRSIVDIIQPSRYRAILITITPQHDPVLLSAQLVADFLRAGANSTTHYMIGTLDSQHRYTTIARYDVDDCRINPRDAIVIHYAAGPLTGRAIFRTNAGINQKRRAWYFEKAHHIQIGQLQ